MGNSSLRYHHIGIPTSQPKDGEKYLPEYKLYHQGYDDSRYRVEWMRYEADSPLPDLVKTIPHIAFEVDDLYKELEGKHVIIEPNSPSKGILVAFIEENGAPIELIQQSGT